MAESLHQRDHLHVPLRRKGGELLHLGFGEPDYRVD